MNLNTFSIPEQYIPSQVKLDKYLCDGEIITWTGAMTSVYSTIETKDAQGNMGPTYLGQVSAHG
jgi:hypothetical protein